VSREAPPPAAPGRRHLARKRFGQHFLIRPETAERIVRLADAGDADTVLEIGPGHGALTTILAAEGPRLFLVEIDRDLVAALRRRFSHDEAIHIVEADILRLDLRSLLHAHAPVTVVANLPYNISTPLLSRLLETPELYGRMVLMLQREVALRLAATPGSKTYGGLSVMIQLSADVRFAFSVPPTAFSPRPKVDSAVVVIAPFAPPRMSEPERRALRRVVRCAFSQRRKQLRNVLAALTPHAEDILRDLDIDPRRRPETLTPHDFLELARILQPGD
jgi:16S rRNA (adenine1518-N6/adenine1519-N6)-dimethyltransferase